MKGVVIALLALVAVSVAYPRAGVSNEAQANQTPDQPTQLAVLITKAQVNIDNLGKQIQEQLNLPNQQSVVDTIKEQSDNLANNVRSYINQVSEDIKAKSPELERLWGDIKGRLSKVADDINAQIPNAQEQAAQLQAKFSEGVKTLVTESDKAAKAISSNSEKVQEDIAKFTKQAVEIAVKATETLNTKLQQAATAKAA